MNEKPRFAAGDTFEHDGVRYRVVKGNRCDGDLVIEFAVSGWYRPEIAHTLILADFKFQVEENNYGKNGKVKRGGQGGWKLINAIKNACAYDGWKKQAEVIRLEVDNKRLKDTEEQTDLFTNPFV